YWLHSKASMGGWQKYINTHTRDALKGGSLAGIGVLAFLAVFREGAETALFYLEMVSNISSADLFAGLAIGFVALLALGFLVVVGMACTGAVPTPSIARVAATAQPQAQAASLPPAPTLTSGRKEALLVAGPRTRLAEAFTAVQQGDFAGARAAMEAYDAEWN